MIQFSVSTRKKTQLVDITDSVREAVQKSGVTDGLCVVHIPHTTAAVTINENSDPDVVADYIMKITRMIPFEEGYRHGEGNSHAHIKSILTSQSATVIIKDGDLALGVWQAIYFCEYDGPRERVVYVQCVGR